MGLCLLVKVNNRQAVMVSWCSQSGLWCHQDVLSHVCEGGGKLHEVLW